MRLAVWSVLVSRRDDLAEVVAEVGAGELVDPGDAAAFTDAIADRHERALLKVAGKRPLVGAP